MSLRGLVELSCVTVSVVPVASNFLINTSINFLQLFAGLQEYRN